MIRSKQGPENSVRVSRKGGMRMRKVLSVALFAGSARALGGSAFAAGDAAKGKADF